ncbi:hypothetical protein [Yinghuangia seranimata]|uniref:hypothetical protein n=1 Tax=Yinghuangia seranimata TaxID=408067 RepID=UPI00248ABA83|nr:hypothetical protein [Yinghuangia seranimata]MDI2131806.1 hypothetical protein [Yinghuangia seranimata]
MSRQPRPHRPLRAFRATAAALAAAALLGACGVGGTTKAEAPPASVCAGMLPTSDVTALLPPGSPVVREEQKPLPKYPLLRCEVSSGGATFVGSVNLPNMAGSELVQLAGSTGAASAPLSGRGLVGMAGPDDAWVTPDCVLGFTDENGKPAKVPVIVRARLLGASNSDHRDELARLVARLAAQMNTRAECEMDPAPGDPDPVVRAQAPQPLSDQPVCGLVDPAALGAVAQGTQRGRWSAARTPVPHAYVETCDLYLDGVRAFSFTVAHGYVAPSAEIPGERPRLTERLPVAPEVTPPPPRGSRVATAMPPGTVIAAVNGTQPAVNGPACNDAYRLARHDGLPAAAWNVPTEQLFHAFVNGAVAAGIGCAPAPDAAWKTG